VTRAVLSLLLCCAALGLGLVTAGVWCDNHAAAQRCGELHREIERLRVANDQLEYEVIVLDAATSREGDPTEQ
jgi:hypothetical protein